MKRVLTALAFGAAFGALAAPAFAQQPQPQVQPGAPPGHVAPRVPHPVHDVRPGHAMLPPRADQPVQAAPGAVPARSDMAAPAAMPAHGDMAAPGDMPAHRDLAAPGAMPAHGDMPAHGSVTGYAVGGHGPHGEGVGLGEEVGPDEHGGHG